MRSISLGSLRAIMLAVALALCLHLAATPARAQADPANLAIMAYLGDPVPAPASMEAKYHPTNLLAAFMAMSKQAGLQVQQLAVDDSEFPFLIYGLLAGKQDFRPIQMGLREKGYEYGGSATGTTEQQSTYFAMNLIPGSQYPSGQMDACNRRLMVRLQMLADRAHWPASLTNAPSNTLAQPLSPALARPPKEDTYTITSVIQVLQPANPADMNDDFQEARVVSQDKDSCTVEITYYPLYRPVIGENPNWRADDASMLEYLRPGPTANWDDAMRRDLLAEIRHAGIEPDRLTDKQLVERVSQWAMSRAHSTDAFAIWAIYYPEGKPAVYPPLRETFDGQKPSPTWTDDQMFEREALGRSMFYQKVHGSCTSSAVYLATILRALGIPTRIVFCIPPFDPNDPAQAEMFYDNIHHHQAREAVRKALDGMHGFANHLFNEVYVGRRWVRLNYHTLGQPVLDEHYFGLLTHIYTCSDLSQAPLAQTWGMRYFKYPADQPKLTSVNPYRLLSVRDHFGANAHVDNPVVAVEELRTVTITGLYRKGSPAIPKWVSDDIWQKTGADFLIAGKEWLPGVNSQMRAFMKHAGHDFRLSAPQHPDIRVHLIDLRLSSGDGTFQAYGAQVVPEDKAKLVPGVPYTIQPINTSETYRWVAAPDLAPLTVKD